MIYNDIVLSMEDAKNLVNYSCLGTEMILYVLMDLEDSMTNLILKELRVCKNDILNIINSSFFLRKKDKEYTNLVKEIIDEVNELEKKKEYVYDEAYLYALVTMKKNSVAKDILKKLKIEDYVILDELNNALSYLEEENNILENLTSLAKNKQIDPFIGRFHLIDRIDSILSKKKKNNCILLGDAGVGKTGLVEGLAYYYLENKPKKTIYSLNIGHLLSGTKYRGDLEERLMDVIDEIKDKDSILFIDEIHNIVASSSSENSLDIASILKPILARNQIKCIGATTLYEYNKYIYPDKALIRRFQNVYVEEASIEETYEILKGLRNSYEEFHKLKYTDLILKEVVNASRLICNNNYPDKALDVLDEVSIYTKKIIERNKQTRKTINKNEIKDIVFESIGINRKKSIKKLDKYHKTKFENIRKYLNVLDLKNYIDIIYYKSKEEKYKILIELKEILDFKKENVLEIDFYDYDIQTLSSSLLGSANGYIGYDEGGILSNHMIKNPFSILIFKNYDKRILKQKNLINKIKNDGFVIDNKGNKLKFYNSIILINEEKTNFEIGYNV